MKGRNCSLTIPETERIVWSLSVAWLWNWATRLIIKQLLFVERNWSCNWLVTFLRINRRLPVSSSASSHLSGPISKQNSAKSNESNAALWQNLCYIWQRRFLLLSIVMYSFSFSKTFDKPIKTSRFIFSPQW